MGQHELAGRLLNVILLFVRRSSYHRAVMNIPRPLLRALRILNARTFTAMVVAASSFLLPSVFAADPTGDLFVASFLTGDVTRLDGATGAIVYSVNQSQSTIHLAE